MGLETTTYISGLVSTNPVVGDDVAQGDDHLRLLKAVLLATFPNADKAFYLPDFEAKSATFLITAADQNKTFLVDTASGNRLATLPSLSSSDDGWVCHFIKTGGNILYIAPASGTLTSGEISGLARARRAIPGHRTTAMWTGGAWYLTRVPNVPVGVCLEFHGATAPTGYVFPYGQTLASASTDYPEYYAVFGHGVVVDKRGRVSYPRDDMGGSAAGRIEATYGGISGTTLGAAGGLGYSQVFFTNLPTYTPTGAVVTSTSVSVSTSTTGSASMPSGASGGFQVGAAVIAVSSTFSGITLSLSSSSSASASSSSYFVGDAQGGAYTPFSNLPPGIVVNQIVVIE